MLVQCKYVTEENDVDERLAQFGVTREQVLRIPRAALAARNDSIPFDPRTAKGQLSYIYGVREKRDVFVARATGYVPVSKENIEYVYDKKNGRKIMFQIADSACVVGRYPRANSPVGPAKGAVVEASSGFLFEEMAREEAERKAELSEFQKAEAWYIFVHFENDGVACELSRPLSLVGQQFSNFVERIFLLTSSDDGPSGLINLDDDVPALEIKPLIERR